MEGLFPDGEEMKIGLKSDYNDEDLVVGRVILLKKRLIFSDRIDQENYPLGNKRGSCQDTDYSFIIHRIVAKKKWQSNLFFFEKGDNDCFPKLCKKNEIIGVILKVEDNPQLWPKLQPQSWQAANRYLVWFFNLALAVYLCLGQEEGGTERKFSIRKWFSSLVARIFWMSFYLICSLFNLRGQ